MGKLLKIINESKKKRNTLFAFSAGRISTGNGVVPAESREKMAQDLEFGDWELGGLHFGPLPKPCGRPWESSFTFSLEVWLNVF